MMKKFLRTALLAALVFSLAAGCSLFASGDGKDGGAGGSSGAVKMTGSYTFEDPADLDFDTRYVLYCDENSAMLSNIPAEYGIIGYYSIYYAKEDAPAGSYDFFVCDSAEHAQAAANLYAGQGMSLTAAEEDPAVVYAVTDGETLEANIIMMQGVGAIKDTTLSGYVDFMKTNSGATLME